MKSKIYFFIEQTYIEHAIQVFTDTDKKKKVIDFCMMFGKKLCKY